MSKQEFVKKVNEIYKENYESAKKEERDRILKIISDYRFSHDRFENIAIRSNMRYEITRDVNVLEGKP